MAIHPINGLIQGDCIDVMGTFPDNCIDVILTSPPYNIRNSSGNGFKTPTKGKWNNASLAEGYDQNLDNLPYDQYIQWQRECLSEMLRIIRPCGAIFYNHKWRVQKGLIQDRHEILEGFPVRQIIIWQRDGGINFNPGYFLPTYEVIYLICGKNFKLKKGANKIGDVWKISQELNTEHPAPFPLELAKTILGSVNASIAMDPFCGSGTTCLAAYILGMDFVGIDTSEKYINMARKRIIEYGNTSD